MHTNKQIDKMGNNQIDQSLKTACFSIWPFTSAQERLGRMMGTGPRADPSCLAAPGPAVPADTPEVPAKFRWMTGDEGPSLGCNW